MNDDDAEAAKSGETVAKTRSHDITFQRYSAWFHRSLTILRLYAFCLLANNLLPTFFRVGPKSGYRICKVLLEYAKACSSILSSCNVYIKQRSHATIW